MKKKIKLQNVAAENDKKTKKKIGSNLNYINFFSGVFISNE